MLQLAFSILTRTLVVDEAFMGAPDSIVGLYDLDRAMETSVIEILTRVCEASVPRHYKTFTASQVSYCRAVT